MDYVWIERMYMKKNKKLKKNQIVKIWWTVQKLHFFTQASLPAEPGSSDRDYFFFVFTPLIDKDNIPSHWTADWVEARARLPAPGLSGAWVSFLLYCTVLCCTAQYWHDYSLVVLGAALNKIKHPSLILILFCVPSVSCHMFHLKHQLIEFWVTGSGPSLVFDPCFPSMYNKSSRMIRMYVG